jgi:hypothetical protein
MILPLMASPLLLQGCSLRFGRMLLPELLKTCKNEPPKAVLRSFKVFYQDPYRSVEEEWGLE